MKTYRTATLLFALLALDKAWADAVLISLDSPGGPSIQAGQIIPVTGSILNLSANPIFITGASGGADFELTVDPGAILSQAPIQILGGDRYTGTLFNLSASNVALPGFYFGWFALQGGPDQFSFDEIGSTGFSIEVKQPGAVPEPSSVLTIAVGLSAAFLLRARRHKKATCYHQQPATAPPRP
jgi:hypothetical protein